VVEGEEACRAISHYPITERGAPLFEPFYAIRNFLLSQPSIAPNESDGVLSGLSFVIK
jgi:hypothetical protein